MDKDKNDFAEYMKKILAMDLYENEKISLGYCACVAEIMNILYGIGKPELLKHGKSGQYSRRIDEAIRLVYDNQIIVKFCKRHYED